MGKDRNRKNNSDDASTGSLSLSRDRKSSRSRSRRDKAHVSKKDRYDNDKQGKSRNVNSEGQGHPVDLGKTEERRDRDRSDKRRGESDENTNRKRPNRPKSNDDSGDKDRSQGRSRAKDRKSSRRHHSDSSDDDTEKVQRRKRSRKSRLASDSSSSSSESSSDSSSSSTSEDRRMKRKKRKRKSSSREHKNGKGKKQEAKSKSSSTSKREQKQQDLVVNERLLAKLAARGETLEERKERRVQQRAAQIKAQLGYTPDDNPFNDPNLHEGFTWKKCNELKKVKQSQKSNSGDDEPEKGKGINTFVEIEKVRQRRKDRESHLEEMDRIRTEESRMKELEHYDDWARKEEEFHLQQQRQRSAIRLVEGREQPIDVLAKNILLFGLSQKESEERQLGSGAGASVKYQEKYNALTSMEQTLQAELEEPHLLLGHLKLEELKSLLPEINAFLQLEREASAGLATSTDDTSSVALLYWNNLRTVTLDEIKYLESGGAKGRHATTVKQVKSIFRGQSLADMQQMDSDIRDNKLPQFEKGSKDYEYWSLVQEQLHVHMAKEELTQLHSRMLVQQLEKLEQKREELAVAEKHRDNTVDHHTEVQESEAGAFIGNNIGSDPSELQASTDGDLEEELGLTQELAMPAQSYSWQDKYRPRKPRYFNRVKTGYDWNKYNQTHYDKENPPPKIVQGYKFNIFYPDLINPASNTPQFVLEPAESDDFCILRFKAGPPYEDVAFQIVNREWNRSRKRGFKCTFERGVLSLYFNFTTHWYRK